VVGPAQLADVIGGAQPQFPGVFTLLDDVDAHHDVCRFRWCPGGSQQEPLVVGFDVVRIDSDGRISSVDGSLDKVPSTTGPANSGHG
jgi:hypothetical protein